MKRIIALLLCIVLAFSLCSCGGAKSEAESADAPSAPVPEPAEPAASSAPADDGVSVYSESVMADSDNAMNVLPAPKEQESPEPQAGMLTAGEWNDNENYGFFTEVLSYENWQSLQKTWGLYPVRRVAVRVTNPDTQEPVKGASVTLSGSQSDIASAVTGADGMAYVYYDISGRGTETPDTATAVFNGVSASEQLDEGGASAEILLSAAADSEKALDLMFVIDTTGSMGDELEYIKTELRDVIERVSRDNDGIDIRLSVNFYRDDGDEYLVRPFAFTGDVDEAVNEISEQCASGGGDFPEAVDKAFANALYEHEWRDSAVKLMFFVLDAPPHSDDQSVPAAMQRCISASEEMGVRVIPVVSSGADTEVEFVMRSAAAITGGTYTFLTDDSGIGGEHLEPTIGDYTVEQFNALMVRVIDEYCA